ncbi:hypothetical protein QZH41_011638, partial [Actinostola sp. cb2023]
NNYQGASDSHEEAGHVTEESAVDIETHHANKGLNDEHKNNEEVTECPSDQQADSHVTGSSVDHVNEPSGCHVTVDENSSTNKGNTCEPENHSVDKLSIETTATANKVNGSVDHVSETRESIELTGSKSNSKDHFTGSNVPFTGSKSDQGNTQVSGNKNDPTDDTVECPQDELNTTVPADPEAQRKLTLALRFACKALPWQHICDQASPSVYSLNISRSLISQEFTVGDLARRLVNLNELDLSNNLLGPQGFRVVCLGVAKNRTLTSLNLSNNLSDTDSSKALGVMLTKNNCLEFLDVSGNDLGMDYFSRCVGPALRINKTLKTLKCASCGATDMAAIMETLAASDGNRSLTALDVSNNLLGVEFGNQVGSALKAPDCSVRSLDVHGTDLHENGMDGLLIGIQNNKSLVEINAGGHNVRSSSFLVDFIYSCIVHPALKQLTLDNTKPIDINQWEKKATSELPKPSSSSMTHLGLSGCSLTDDAIASVTMETGGLLSSLSYVSLSGNSNLTVGSLQSLYKMMNKGKTRLWLSASFSVPGLVPRLFYNVSRMRGRNIPLSHPTTVSTKYFDFSPQASINLTGLGGEPGDYGSLLDSLAIQTDYSRKHKRTLSLQDALSMSAVLSNSNGREMTMSQEEWDLIISADKDAPAWLQVSSHRKRAIYISNLPLTATREKLDSLLENDADCDLKEVFLLK